MDGITSINVKNKQIVVKSQYYYETSSNRISPADGYRYNTARYDTISEALKACPGHETAIMDSVKCAVSPSAWANIERKYFVWKETKTKEDARIELWRKDVDEAQEQYREAKTDDQTKAALARLQVLGVEPDLF